MIGRTSALSRLATRVAARGMGAGKGGGGHANNPTFMFQKDWSENKWKGMVFVVSVITAGTLIPLQCIRFAQRKAGNEW